MAASNGIRSREAKESVAGFFALTVAALIAAMLHWSPLAVWSAGFGAFAAGAVAWIVAVEQRLPSPFGPRVPASKGGWPEYLGVVLMVIVFNFSPWPHDVYFPASTGLGSPLRGFEGQINVLQVPANAAATLVAGAGLAIIATLVARSVAEALRDRRSRQPGDIPAR